MRTLIKRTPIPKPNRFSGILTNVIFFFIKAKNVSIAFVTVSFFNADKGKKNETGNRKPIRFGYILFFILLSSFAARAQTEVLIDNGNLTNDVTTPIVFSNGDPRVRSIATGTLPLLSDGAISITFTLKGGDGGTATWDGVLVDLIAEGGEGGTVTFKLPITTENEGQEFTFYQGKRGEAESHNILASGGGGGSTAIEDHNDTLLAVAGAGGGACAVEADQSDGLPGGVERWGLDDADCYSPAGQKGYAGHPSGYNNDYVISDIINETNDLFTASGGGGGFEGECNSSTIHYCEAEGKSAEFGGAGGHHPVGTFSIGEDCNPGDPFGLGCSLIIILDIGGGGAGYGGGGVGGAYHNNGSIITSNPECLEQTVGYYGGGGGGAGYFGGGGGGFELGGGGGSSWVHPSITDEVFTEGGTTPFSTVGNNGTISYSVAYDTQDPLAVCQNATLTLGVGAFITADGGLGTGPGIRGEATLDPTSLDGGSIDDGVIVNWTASQTEFSCANLGTQPIFLTVTDAAGNTDNCMTTLTVVDDHAPTITLATSNVINAPGFGTVNLGSNTEMTITPPTLGFEDNCTVAAVVQAEPFTVTCADIGQTIVKEVTAADISGNTRTIYLEYVIIGPSSSPVIYVDRSATGGANDGSDWANAFLSLESALENQKCLPEEIRVASGTYTPSTSRLCTNCAGNEDLYFLLSDDLVLKGSYNPLTGLQEYDDPTILSGDLGGGTQTYSVVLAAGVPGTTTTMDGFVITDGRGTTANTSRSVDGNAFPRNEGGGISCVTGNLQISNCRISGNQASTGGGISVDNAICTMTNTLISGNVGGEGGGLGVSLNSDLTVINTTIAGNHAFSGGGTAGTFTAINSIIWGNGATFSNPETFGSFSATYSLIKGNNPSGTGNLNGNLPANDPQFADPIAASGTSTIAGDYRINDCSSSVIDAGNNAANSTASDLDGNSRTVNGNNSGTATIDMGAYERPALAPLFSSFSVTACNSYTVPSGDETYTTSQTVTDTLPSTCGVDSILTIELYFPMENNLLQDRIADDSVCVMETLAYTAQTDFVNYAQFESGMSDYIELNSLAADLASGNRSVFLWMNAGDVTVSKQTLFAINTSAGGNVCLLFINTDNELEMYDGAAYHTSSTVVADSLWHYVGYTYDETTGETRLYADGIDLLSYAVAQSSTVSDQFSIGQEFDGSNTSNHYSGRLTEVSVWNEVLTPSDIALAMNAAIEPSHPAYTYLVGYYPMMDTCGVTDNIVRDHSGNDRNGNASSQTVRSDDLLRIPGFNSAFHFDKDWSSDLQGSFSAANSIAPTVTATETFTLTLSRDLVEITDSWTVLETGGSIDATVTDASPTLTANATGATYQWLDCNNGFAMITDETDQSFNASGSGSFAVEVTENGCADTSACIVVTVTGVEDDRLMNATVYPNPTSGNLQIDLNAVYSNIEMTVSDVLGRELNTNVFRNTNRLRADLTPFSEGIYVVRIIADRKEAVVRVVRD